MTGKNKAQRAAEAQAKQLKEQRRKEAAEAARLAAENQSKADARRRRLQGRSSLINTTELGVTEDLG